MVSTPYSFQEMRRLFAHSGQGGRTRGGGKGRRSISSFVKGNWLPVSSSRHWSFEAPGSIYVEGNGNYTRGGLALLEPDILRTLITYIIVFVGEVTGSQLKIGGAADQAPTYAHHTQ